MNWFFANPWMLAGLGALGLPVLLHYLTRARPRRIVFPPFKFLHEACAGQQSTYRLRTLILLTLRTLAVLALVLLFARPYLVPGGLGNQPEASKRVVLILDASLSMRGVQRGTPLFTRAQAEAADVLRDLEPDSEAAIIFAGASARALLPALSRNLPALHQELVKAKPTLEQGDPGAALALAMKMLKGVGTIYIFSDFQKSNWEQLRELPAGAACRLRAVAMEPLANVALTSLRAEPAEPVAGEAMEVIATVFNCTAQPRQETVKLELAEMPYETRVSVPPFGTAQAVFQSRLTKPGPVLGKATLNPDDLPDDNTRYLSVPVHRALHVLLISDTEATDQRSAAYFVARALVPSTNVVPGLSVVRRHSQDADRGMLETADVFLLVAPALPTGETVEIIERRVREGAHVIAWLDGPGLSASLLPGFAPPFQVLLPATSEAGVHLIAGPALLFPESELTDLGALRFHRYQQNQILQGRTGEIFLSYPDGSAALTMSAVGKGTAVIGNIPLTPESGNFVGHPMFPTLWHELLRSLRAKRSEYPVSPGAGWTMDVPTVGEGEITVTGPKGESVAVQRVASGRTTRLAMPPAAALGDYHAWQGERLASIAVINVDPRESDTRPIAWQNIKQAPGAEVTFLQDNRDVTVAGKFGPLWPTLAAITAALLLLEMLLLALWRRQTTASARPEPGNNARGKMEPERRKTAVPAGTVSSTV